MLSRLIGLLSPQRFPKRSYTYEKMAAVLVGADEPIEAVVGVGPLPEKSPPPPTCPIARFYPACVYPTMYFKTTLPRRPAAATHPPRPSSPRLVLITLGKLRHRSAPGFLRNIRTIEFRLRLVISNMPKKPNAKCRLQHTRREEALTQTKRLLA
jgi:hypothetical protein